MFARSPTPYRAGPGCQASAAGAWRAAAAEAAARAARASSANRLSREEPNRRNRAERDQASRAWHSCPSLLQALAVPGRSDIPQGRLYRPPHRNVAVRGRSAGAVRIGVVTDSVVFASYDHPGGPVADGFAERMMHRESAELSPLAARSYPPVRVYPEP